MSIFNVTLGGVFCLGESDGTRLPTLDVATNAPRGPRRVLFADCVFTLGALLEALDEILLQLVLVRLSLVAHLTHPLVYWGGSRHTSLRSDY